MSFWLRAAGAAIVAHLIFLAIVLARPGRPAVVLWLVGRPIIGAGAALLLALALVRAWRDPKLVIPDGRRLSAVVGLVVVTLVTGLFRTYPSSYAGRPSQTEFRLPLDGQVTVVWGGPSRTVNYHAAMAAQRYAYDLLVTVDGRSFRGDGFALEEYYAFGRPVLAPAAGIVRVVHDAEPDRGIGDWPGRPSAGNHVVIEVGAREFLFVAHLQQGSIAVSPGDRVEAGQLLGRVGNSGDSSEPHVHVHLQDAMTGLGEGIPMYFHGYRSGGSVISRGMPQGGRDARSGRFTGEIVEHAAP